MSESVNKITHVGILLQSIEYVCQVGMETEDTSTTVDMCGYSHQYARIILVQLIYC